MTAEETKQHKPILQSIRERKFKEYITESYITPALLEQERKFKKEQKLLENTLKVVSKGFDDWRLYKEMYESNRLSKEHNKSIIKALISSQPTRRNNR